MDESFPARSVDEIPVPRWRWSYVVLWAAAFAAALCGDRPAAAWARSSGVARAVKGSWEAEVVKAPGTFWFSLALLAALVAAGQVRWRGAVLALAVVAASATNGVVKWVVGRTRPFKLPGGELRPFELHPFWHGWHGFFVQRDLTFPSGHACTAWALAAGLAIVWPRGAWAAIVLAAVTGVERVLENAHYVSDVVAGFGFSTVLAWGVGRVMLGWVNRPPTVTGGLGVVQKLPVDARPVR